MIHRRDWPKSQAPNEEKRKASEPPMNTDEHRLKADNAKALFRKFLSVFIMQLSVFIGVHRWLEIFFLPVSKPGQFGVFSLGSL